MNDEIKQYLKDNLTVELYLNADSDFDSDIKVELSLEGEVISSDWGDL